MDAVVKEVTIQYSLLSFFFSAAAEITADVVMDAVMWDSAEIAAVSSGFYLFFAAAAEIPSANQYSIIRLAGWFSSPGGGHVPSSLSFVEIPFLLFFH